MRKLFAATETFIYPSPRDNDLHCFALFLIRWIPKKVYRAVGESYYPAI